MARKRLTRKSPKERQEGFARSFMFQWSEKGKMLLLRYKRAAARYSKVIRGSGTPVNKHLRVLHLFLDMSRWVRDPADRKTLDKLIEGEVRELVKEYDSMKKAEERD